MKAFFLSRLLREKIALVGLIALAAAMWIFSVFGRGRLFSRDFSLTTTELTEQKHWLHERARIEREAKSAVEHLDPSRTFDKVRLQAELDAIARSVGLSKDTSIDDTQTSPGPQFSLNSVRFVIRNAEWPTLERFYNELTKRAPYIGIEEFSMLSNRANQSQLTASLRVSSVEIAR
jgi:hypothetical protein